MVAARRKAAAPAGDTLARYREKRDFAVTAEPSGARAPAAGPALRFVVQKHDARRLHYDLRLEMDGVFKSWAVTRGPSPDPADKRLAVEVEDHPLDYGDFEGTIPQGEYGGGTVMVWDRGTWEPEPGPEDWRATWQERGELKFRLHGEKLRGGWVLVRLKPRAREKRVNWLLIKHRDEMAVAGGAEALLAEDRSVASGRGLAEIAAHRGREPAPFMVAAAPVKRAARPRAKAAEVEKTGGAAMPAFVAPQLCRSVERPPEGAEWAHEIKFDGYRALLRVEGGRARVLTRSGLDWTEKFGAIARSAGALPDGMIDGEIVALDAEGAPDFPALQAAISSGRDEALIFFAFDLLFLDGVDWRGRTLRERKKKLEAMLGAVPGGARLRYVTHFSAAADAVLQSACQMKLEGIVSKKLDAPYVSGRSEGWTKAKCRGGQEVVVGGWTERAGAFRSLLVGTFQDGALIYLGRVGTGFGQGNLPGLMAALRGVEQAEMPFARHAELRRVPEAHWVAPRLVAEIAFAGFTGDGLLRQASFKGLREDKPAEEVTREAVPAREAALAQPVAPAGPRAGGQANAVLGVALSHPEKVFWGDAPDGPVTKRDLAEYLAAVAGPLLAYIAGRPCSVIRAPDGAAGEHFFQRHAGRGTSALVTQVKVGGEEKPYLQFDRPEALVAVAQMAGLELHPWNCLPGEPETPGRLVFDLDPAPDVPFARVIAGAHAVRERLARVGLTGFCKTTGGKGLHVVAPLAAPRRGAGPEWKEAKMFARLICEQMEADAPGEFVVNMAKKKRVGRIFLDYLRNDRTATAVAAYSPRARPGAPVSWPVDWGEVVPGLNPARVTLRSVPGLLAGRRVWEGFGEAAVPLRDAIEKSVN